VTSAACPRQTTAPDTTAGGQPACPGRNETGRFIPYVTPLKSERPVPMSDLVPRPDGPGVTYRDETPEDRDRHGALWVRLTAPAGGRAIPVFRQVHPRRAAETALDMRCQGCFGEPDRSRQGILFFLKPDPRRRNLHWPETEYTHHPPVCLPCAHRAMLDCPFVREAPALRVRNPRPWGVDGLGYAIDDRGQLRELCDMDRCSYDDLKLLPWMLALQPIIRLSRCTAVDIHAELAAAGLDLPEHLGS
jgi:hypothetical protein